MHKVMAREFGQTRHGSVVGWGNIALLVSLCLVAWSSTSAYAKSRVEASLPELVSLLSELSPQQCFQVGPFGEKVAVRTEIVRFVIQTGNSNKPEAWTSIDLRATKLLGSERLPAGTRVLFSPWRTLNVLTVLIDTMSALEPLCAHSLEQRGAIIERRLMSLISRIELSTQELATKEKSLIAFDIETMSVVEGLDLPLAGTMATRPKGLPSPAQFGRQIGKFKEMNVAAIIHAKGGDLAQPRAASRELSVPLVVLDLDKEIPSSLTFSQYLEEFYRAVLSGLGVRLIPSEEREN